jgi:LemA protein
MFESGWFWGLCALTVFWALGAYNRLVRLRAQVSIRYVELMAVLQGQIDLAQQALSDAAADPVLERAAADASHVAASWRRLNHASTQASVALARMQEHPLLAQSAIDLGQAWATLEAVWDELRVSPWHLLAESVRQQWQQQHLLAQPLRRAFNQAIEQYNHAVAQWPARWIAHSFRFEPAHGLDLA